MSITEKYCLNNKYRDLKSLAYDLSKEVTNRTSIHCGHYIIEQSQDDNIEYFIPSLSMDSLSLGIILYLEAKKNKLIGIKLSLLINDFGVNKENRKIYRDEFELPKEYLELLGKSNIPISEVEVTFESRLRNRADKQLKKGRKNGRLIVHNNQLLLNPEYNDGFNEDVSNKPKEGKPVPNCRIMLGQDLLDKENSGYRTAINICNAELYECKGKYVIVYHKFLGGSMNVINVYLLRKTDAYYETEITAYS
ncbi:MAG: hypothetical protein KAG56_10325 [Sulfurovaceae bacterium]|nr:hypothetical protein [Sulfurovaceae bacterium]